MSHVEAIYHHGVFEPLESVNLRDQQRVHLSFEPAKGQPPQAWLNQVQAMQAAIVKRQGFSPIARRRLRRIACDE